MLKPFTLLGCMALFQPNAEAARLNIPRQKQQQSKWCWAASASMCHSRYGINTTQKEIVKAVKGSAVNQTAKAREMAKAIQAGGIPSRCEGILSEQRIKSDADQGKPFIFAWYWNKGGGHALCYDGYQNSQYYVIDPWQNNGTSAHSYRSLTNAGGKGKWRETMSCQKESLCDDEWDNQGINLD